MSQQIPIRECAQGRLPAPPWGEVASVSEGPGRAAEPLKAGWNPTVPADVVSSIPSSAPHFFNSHQHIPPQRCLHGWLPCWDSAGTPTETRKQRGRRQGPTGTRAFLQVSPLETIKQSQETHSQIIPSRPQKEPLFTPDGKAAEPPPNKGKPGEPLQARSPLSKFANHGPSSASPPAV